VKLGIAMLLSVFFTAAQDIKLNVTYVCDGEHIYVESCNIRDLSDTSTCMVAHPDRPKHNGFMAYTNETRGTLKKLFPTCKQPTPQELAAADAFKKKQQEIYDANVAKANPQASSQTSSRPNAAAPVPQGAARPTPPKNAEERAMRRCVFIRTTSGHLHRQLVAGRVWPDGCPGASLRRQGARSRPGNGGRLRGPRKLAHRLH